MKKSYFPENGVWLKGNLHSHTTVSDGVFTPLELAKLYIGKGYDFLAMSDHNVFVTHSEVPEKELILLTAVEHDIEYRSDKCLHVVGVGQAGKSATFYPCRRYTKEELSDQQLVDLMERDGQFVTLAHPVWSHMEAHEVLDLERLHAIEVYNNGTEHLVHGGNAELYWDLLLRGGKRVFGTASDDVHVPEDLFGGWVWVKALERSKRGIMDALFSGAFYASAGPVIHDFGVEDGQVYLECSPCRAIHFVSFMPRGRSFFAPAGELMTQARHTLVGNETYCRAVCVDEQGHSAWTQPIFFDR